MKVYSLFTVLVLVLVGGCSDPPTPNPSPDAGTMDAPAMDIAVPDVGTVDGGLRCPEGQSICAGQCVNPQTDGAHCGACDRACPAGQMCSLGRCATSCAAVLATCSGGVDGGEQATYCADPRTDRLNCGACGFVCAAGHVCVDRACVLSCAAGQRDCGGTCRDLQTDDAHCGACGRACPTGNTCAAGVCTPSCGAGLTVCAGSCANLVTDNANCGACGTVCPAGSVCSGGACGTTCAAPLTTCGAVSSRFCADTTIDPANCGACGAACALAGVAAAGCSGGACAVVRCATGRGDCDGVASNGCEVDTTASAPHCGGCGRACLLPHATSSCATGECAVTTCDAGYADCDSVASNGCEVDQRTDNANCGACRTACAAGAVCSGGVCGATCAAPLATCGSASTAFCANTALDPTNCGACGSVCALPNAATHTCTGGTCAPTRCAAGYGDCDGAAANGCETDLAASATSCGACGRTCALPNATATCTAGSCAVSACAAGFADCNGNPADGCEVNTRTDNASCGVCGTACAAGAVCSGGVCGATCAAPLATCGTSSSAFCANTAIDPANCGACGTACALPGVAAHGCAAGACAVVRCNAGAGDCNGAAGDGCETNLQASEANCGACGRACALPNASATCTGGSCAVAACAPGFADCDRNPANGCEVDTRTDNASCGACGTACGAGAVCSGGVCGATCAAPLSTCGTGAMAFCANTALDPANCGGCGRVCGLTNVASNGCASGACAVVRCTGGYGDCDGTASNGCETDLSASATSCGACGRACTLPNAAAACTAGACAVSTCAAGFADCDGAAANGCEVDTRTSNAHCGACGAGCSAGSVCSAGACSATCAAPLSTCGTGAMAFCANTALDPGNCGGCGVVCALSRVASNGCAAGACTVVRCAGGYGDCDGLPGNGCETDLTASSASCGACGRTCVLANATAACAAGACAVTACATGFADCNANPADGCEVDTRSNNASCGGCGMACAAGSVCSGGACATTCASPQLTCGVGPSAACANTSIDPNHCGACGRVCALANVASGACAAGACTVVTCAAGFGDCNGSAADGCETNTRTTLASCGACGRTCALPHATAACAAGTCTIGTCAAGFVDCNANPADGCEVDTRTDNASCGACGVSCAAGSVCSGGVCGATCASPLRTCGSGSTAYCANSNVDPANCGACGAVCALANVATNGCASGVCAVFACAGSYGNCDGSAANGCEADLTASATNCGSCGRSCAAPHATTACAIGACAVTACATGYADCDGLAANGCEVDTRTDSLHCGGCATSCGGGMSCSGGACGTTCGGTQANCGGTCATLASDPNHCGSCTTVCPTRANATTYCAASACGFACAAGFADCDGSAANGCEAAVGASCTAGVGGCRRSGFVVCSGATTACNAASGAPGVEVCDGVDNDCNGAIDESLTRSCYAGPAGTVGVGLCRAGTQTCAAGSWGSTCAEQVGPGTETCNNADDNCDGAVDESPAASSCPAVSNATPTCTAGVCGFACNPGAVLVGGVCTVMTLTAARPIAPLSTATVTSRRPLLRWALPSGDGARIDLCRNRALTTGCVTFDAVGTSGAPAADLAAGVWFWRLTVRSGGMTTSTAGPTWQFTVGARTADGPNTSSGTSLDVNGDGYSDLAIANKVYLGGPGTFPPSATPLTLAAPSGGGSAASVSASAGDLNGDGYADLVAGASGSNMAYVYPGGPSFPSATTSILYGPPGSNFFGQVVAGAGDLNGDGYADLAVSSTNSNAAYVYLGGAGTFPPSFMPIILNAPAGVTHFGLSLASAGDLNGDGYADLVVGSDTANAVYVYLGGPGAFPASPTPITLVVPSAAVTTFGQVVAGAGDLNGDGYTELVVGAYFSNLAYVYFGGAGTFPSTAPVPLGPVGTSETSYFGRAATGAGDLNGDGFGDLAVGAPLGYRTYVFMGGAGTFPTAPVPVILNGPSGTENFGTALTGGLDLNGDAHADLVVAVFRPTNRKYVFMGAAGTFPPSTTPITFTVP